MSSYEVFELLRGERRGAAFGATWLNEAMGTQDIADQALAMELDFVFVDAQHQDSAAVCMALNRTRVVPVWVVSGVVGRVAHAQGWPHVIRSSARTPTALHEPFACGLDDASQEIRTGVAAGAVAILIADDLSSSAGWLVAPDFALDVAVPCYRTLVDDIARADGIALFHSDGDVRALFGALARSGFSAVHLAGASGTAGEAARCARAVGLAPLGGISASELRSEQAARDAGEAAAALAREGALLICDDGGLSTSAEVDYLGKALRTARAML